MNFRHISLGLSVKTNFTHDVRSFEYIVSQGRGSGFYRGEYLL